MPLNFPNPWPLEVRQRAGRLTVFDPVRRRFVPLTPEEWVRQHLLGYLVNDRGCPLGLTAVECAVTLDGRPFRADLVVHDRRGQPLLAAECKEPGVTVGPATLEQLAVYNRALRARYLLVTNGLEHYCCALDLNQQTPHFLAQLPRYADL